MIIDDDDEDRGDMVTHHGAKEQHLLSDIEKLRIEKEQLTRRLQDQQQTKQDIKVRSPACGLHILQLIYSRYNKYFYESVGTCNEYT